MTKRQQHYESRVGAIERLLRTGPHCLAQIAAEIFMSPKAVRSYLVDLLGGPPRRIHVAEWRRTPYPIAYYGWGDLPDEPAPVPMTPDERVRMSRARLKAKPRAEPAPEVTSGPLCDPYALPRAFFRR